MNLDILKFKLQQALQNNVAKRRKLATSWRIEPSRLAHYKTSKLLYSQPIPDTGKEYKYDIMLDVSASMHKDWSWGGKHRIWKAIEATQNLIKLFHWVIDFRILVFWAWFTQMSVNQILSITPEKIRDINDYFRLLGWPMKKVKTKEWKRNLIPLESDWQPMAYWTWWPAVLWHSIQSMASEKWEKFMVFITDWEDVLQRFGWDRWWRDLDWVLDEICWVDVKKYCPENYPKIIDEIKENDLSILPIWIDIELQHFPNGVEINDASEIYEKTINFIEDNFNK